MGRRAGGAGGVHLRLDLLLDLRKGGTRREGSVLQLVDSSSYVRTIGRIVSLHRHKRQRV